MLLVESDYGSYACAEGAVAAGFLAGAAFAATFAQTLSRLFRAFRRARFRLILSYCVISGVVNTIKQTSAAIKSGDNRQQRDFVRMPDVPGCASPDQPCSV